MANQKVVRAKGFEAILIASCVILVFSTLNVEAKELYVDGASGSDSVSYFAKRCQQSMGNDRPCRMG